MHDESVAVTNNYLSVIGKVLDRSMSMNLTRLTIAPHVSSSAAYRCHHGKSIEIAEDLALRWARGSANSLGSQRSPGV